MKTFRFLGSCQLLLLLFVFSFFPLLLLLLSIYQYCSGAQSPRNHPACTLQHDLQRDELTAVLPQRPDTLSTQPAHVEPGRAIQQKQIQALVGLVSKTCISVCPREDSEQLQPKIVWEIHIYLPEIQVYPCCI